MACLLGRDGEMLKLLPDEHISPSVAVGLRWRQRLLKVLCMVDWENCQCLGQDDSACLEHAAMLGLTLVTYESPDRTIDFSDNTRFWTTCGLPTNHPKCGDGDPFTVQHGNKIFRTSLVRAGLRAGEDL